MLGKTNASGGGAKIESGFFIPASYETPVTIPISSNKFKYVFVNAYEGNYLSDYMSFAQSGFNTSCIAGMIYNPDISAGWLGIIGANKYNYTSGGATITNVEQYAAGISFKVNISSSGITFSPRTDASDPTQNGTWWSSGNPRTMHKFYYTIIY